MTKSSWPGAFAAYSAVFEQMKKNPAPAMLFIGVSLAASLVSLVAQGHTSYVDSGHQSYEDIVTLIFFLALTVYGLALADRRRISLGEFVRFNAKKYFILLAVAVLAVLAVGVSLLLLIVPAIWVIAWVSFSNYAAVDKSMGPIQALKESKRLAQGHVAKVWGLIGVAVLFTICAAIVAVIPFIGVIGIEFVSLLTYGAFAVLYRWLQRNPASGPKQSK